ncbi:hypothetical protein FPOAC2_05268 [Fusarium poae]
MILVDRVCIFGLRINSTQHVGYSDRIERAFWALRTDVDMDSMHGITKSGHDVVAHLSDIGDVALHKQSLEMPYLLVTTYFIDCCGKALTQNNLGHLGGNNVSMIPRCHDLHVSPPAAVIQHQNGRSDPHFFVEFPIWASR